MNKSFTLVEVLITIGIIGVVGAITIPNLVQSAREKATVTKVKKTYSMLTQAYNYAIAEYGTPEGWSDAPNNMYSVEQHANFANKLKPFLKLSEDCVGKTQNYTKNHCYKSATISQDYAYLRLLNGVTLSFRILNKDCNRLDAVPAKNISCGFIQAYLEPFGTNIKNGTNIFNFWLTNEGIIPFGKENSSLTFERACNTSIANPYSWFPNNMYACAAWVIYNENMDYLHCTDLSWKGKKTCK